MFFIFVKIKVTSTHHNKIKNINTWDLFGQEHKKKRLGRTSIWWDNFCEQVVVDSEWKENFRMTRHRSFHCA